MEIEEKKTSKKDYHYVASLPFRETFREALFLRRRFLKGQKFFDNYKKFMDKLLVKSYAKQSEVMLSWRTWYILHHRVYHPSKPGKIRVVFDHSTKCQGKSINRELLTGPYLTNQIIRIMARFRKKR